MRRSSEGDADVKTVRSASFSLFHKVATILYWLFYSKMQFTAPPPPQEKSLHKYSFQVLLLGF